MTCYPKGETLGEQMLRLAKVRHAHIAPIATDSYYELLTLASK